MREQIAIVENLDFRYQTDGRSALCNLSLELFSGQRCLLVGANGAGKSTLLRVLAGQHMVSKEKALVLGRPVFHDTSLVKDVRFIGGVFPCDSDVTVAKMLEWRTDVDPARREELVELLEIDLDWHMHRISDGQRRRVQILLHLEQPKKLLLLDEVTTDLDVVARADFLSFLKEDSTTHGTAILYATHIFDSLEEWATDLVLLEKGRVVLSETMVQLPGLAQVRKSGVSSPLCRLVEQWIRFGFVQSLK